MKTLKKESVVVTEHLNGCFGDLLSGFDPDKGHYFRCVCNTANISSDPNEEKCNYCMFKNKKIKIVNYEVQKVGIGFSGMEDLASHLKEELK